MQASPARLPVKRGRRWAVRWYDEKGKPQFRGGFETKMAAREWLDAKVSEVRAVRRGDPVAIRRRQLPTFSELVAEYFGQHVGEENTKRALRERLRYARDAWGDLRIDRLNARDIAAWRARRPERSAWGITKALRAVLNYACGSAGWTRTLPPQFRIRSRSAGRSPPLGRSRTSKQSGMNSPPPTLPSLSSPA
jgi:hypothetical protein